MGSERSGVHRLLRVTAVYNFVQRLFGSPSAMDLLVRQYIRPSPGTSILDLGSGTGLIAESLGDVSYLGIEPNADYVRDFNQRSREPTVRMLHGTTRTVAVPPGEFDIALVLAVLHHVEDAVAREILGFAFNALRPGGRIVVLDNVLHDGQNPIARLLVRADRGKHVRWVNDYQTLFSDLLALPHFHLRTDLLRYPYSHIITTVTKQVP